MSDCAFIRKQKQTADFDFYFLCTEEDKEAVESLAGVTTILCPLPAVRNSWEIIASDISCRIAVSGGVCMHGANDQAMVQTSISAWELALDSPPIRTFYLLSQPAGRAENDDIPGSPEPSLSVTLEYTDNKASFGKTVPVRVVSSKIVSLACRRQGLFVLVPPVETEAREQYSRMLLAGFARECKTADPENNNEVRMRVNNLAVKMHGHLNKENEIGMRAIFANLVEATASLDWQPERISAVIEQIMG